MPTNKNAKEMTEEMTQLADRLERIERNQSLILSLLQPKKKERWLTIAEASEYSSLAESTLRLYCNQGKIEHERAGKRIAIRTEVLDEFMKSGKHRTVEDRANEILNRLSN